MKRDTRGPGTPEREHLSDDVLLGRAERNQRVADAWFGGWMPFWAQGAEPLPAPATTAQSNAVTVEIELQEGVLPTVVLHLAGGRLEQFQAERHELADIAHAMTDAVARLGNVEPVTA